MERTMSRWAGLLMVLVVVGCAGSEVDSSAEALIPTGSNAVFVSSTIPTTMFPGERLDVTVTMRNTGTGGASNNWTTSSPSYAFFRTSSTTFSLSYDTLEAATAVGSTVTQRFVLTAPTTPGSYTFTGRMGIVGDAQFGDIVSVPITVDAGSTRRWGCAFVSGSSSIPTSLAPGESRLLTVAVQNTGSATWTSSGFFLYSQDTPVGLWNNINRALATTVAPGATTVFSVPVTAPSTPGTYRFRRQMYTNTLGFFDNTTSCVDATITVGGSPALNSSFVANTLPSVLAPSELRTVTVTARNTGTAGWPSDGSIFLYSANSPIGLYGVELDYMTGATAVGADQVFSFVIRAPSAAGSYTHAWRMYSNSSGFFGPTLSVPLTVDGAATPTLNAVVASQTIPAVVTAGRTTTFSVTMQNTGSGAWSGSSFALYSTNTPLSVWGRNATFLGSAENVAVGASRVFSFTVTAPTTAGTYASRWRMWDASTGFFGAEAATTGITVTLCGNGTVNAGESCDDNNLTSGDGCSTTCTAEVVEYDLATASSTDRSLVDSSPNRQLGTVAIGDVTGDAVRDIVVADAADVIPAMGSARSAAGIVYGYGGGASFFTNATTTVPTGAAFRILGASANDRLGTGASSGDVDLGDVTGDSVSDVIVSSAFADGDAESRADAGEVYVLTGGAGLTGDIDLGATTAPTALRARIIGATAGDRLMLLAVGELSGDSIADLVLSAPFADTANGVDSGAVYVVLGGATLTGTIDLGSIGAAGFVILGPAANAKMGTAAAIGNFTGNATGDLVVGNSAYSVGLSRRGAAWGFVGPIASNLNAGGTVGSAGAAAFAWLGANQNDNFGNAVAIGNVVGNGTGDVVIGAYQQRRAGTQVGAVNVWNGTTLTSGTTYDLSTSGMQTVVFLGADSFDNAGTALALGDMNNDGFLDIPVASGLADGVGNARLTSGEVVVFFGSATLNGTIDLSATRGRVHVYGGSASDGLGLHSSEIAFGDIDGDGFADLCIGGYLGGPADGGRVDCIQSTF